MIGWTISSNLWCGSSENPRDFFAFSPVQRFVALDMEAMVSCLERFKLLHSMYFHMYIVHLYAHNTCTKYHFHPKESSQKTDPVDFGPEILVPPQSFLQPGYSTGLFPGSFSN